MKVENNPQLWSEPVYDRRAAFTRAVARWADRQLFPALMALAFILVPSTIYIPVLLS